MHTWCKNAWPREPSITAHGEMLNELHENKMSRLLKIGFVLYLEAGTEDRRVEMIKLQLEPVEQCKKFSIQFG